MVGSGFIILILLVALLRFGGCGHKRQMMTGLGLAFLFRFPIRPGLYSMLLLMP